MNNDAQAAAAFLAWVPVGNGDVEWTRSTIEGSPGFVLEVPEPFAAILVARHGYWELLLTTARGEARPYLGAIDDEPAVVFDALLYSVYARAQSELEYRDRTASAALAVVLRDLARCVDEARYGGRAAMLLGVHAAKEELNDEAASLFRQAIALFTAADDVTAADSAREALSAVRAHSAS